MKMSLAWQKQCLENSLETLTREENALRNMQERVHDMKKRCEKYEQQVAEAERQGKDGFDNELFLKQRRNRDNNQRNETLRRPD